MKRTMLRTGLCVLMLMGCWIMTSARQLWLAPNGTGDGMTEVSPLGNAQQAIESLVAGDTLWVKAGTYAVDDMINVRKSGNRRHRICVFGYGEGRAVLDFTNQPHTGDKWAQQFRGVLMNPCADYWYWRDIDFTHAADNGMKLEASYTVLERCNFYRNGDTGLQLGFDKDGDGGNNRNQKFLYGRYNQIINCDSYYNYDIQDNGGNADGFANKLYPGPGNEWHGDRCWGNSDDGWDLYYAAYPCVIENCWAIWNGYLEGGAIGVNGNGFKQGGNKQGGGSYGAHIFINDVAAYNLYHGFDQNNHNEGNWIINCTAFENKQVNFRFNCDVEMVGNTVFHLRNCLGFRPGEANHRFGDMWPDSKATNWTDILGVSPQYNMGKGTNPETGQEYVRISAKDWPNYDDQFEDISMETAIGPRQENGELPLHFARLKEGSIFIDKGVAIDNLKCEDVFKEQYKLAPDWLDDYSRTITLPYNGDAPDYGAFEYGMERPAYNAVEMLPVNDGTLFDEQEVNLIDGTYYVEKKLIDDYLFQDAQLADDVKQYVTGESTTNSILPTYYGKSGSKAGRKIGELYTGGTEGAYKVAKSGGFIELTLPSLSMLRSDLYPGGKNVTIDLQWHYADNSASGTGESVTYDQRMHCYDFNAHGIPRSTKPIVVRLTNNGSNDLYLTDLLASGFEEASQDVIDGIASAQTDQREFFFTSNGVIAYGDISNIEVYDAAGRQVASSQLSQFCNLSNLNKGVFTVVVTAKDGEKSTRKFLRR